MAKFVVQFGAGNIGRGFLGHLYWESGYEVIFIDINKELVEKINARGSYTLKIVGPTIFKEIEITNIRALHFNNREEIIDKIAHTTLVSTSVGINALPNVAPIIAEGIKRKFDSGEAGSSYLNIVICENLLHAGKVFKDFIIKYYESNYRDEKRELLEFVDTNVGFVETVVSRMIPVLPEEEKRKDVLLVVAEDYSILPVDKKGFVKGKEIPQIKGFKYEENLQPYEEMKLFIHNLSHAMFAYLGYQKGYTYIWECVEDEEIFDIVRKAMYEESIPALVKKWNLDKNEVYSYMENLILRFKNRNLGDTVYRVAREPLRKLSPQDRLIGGARLALSEGFLPKCIARGVAAALKYDYPQDKEAKEMQNIISQHGYEEILSKVCGLEEGDILYEMVLSYLK
jgi:mannitol-1-phosphate 5-dehydrogenase